MEARVTAFAATPVGQKLTASLQPLGSTIDIVLGSLPTREAWRDILKELGVGTIESAGVLAGLSTHQLLCYEQNAHAAQLLPASTPNVGSDEPPLGDEWRAHSRVQHRLSKKPDLPHWKVNGAMMSSTGQGRGSLSLSSLYTLTHTSTLMPTSLTHSVGEARRVKKLFDAALHSLLSPHDWDRQADRPAGRRCTSSCTTTEVAPTQN